MLSQSPSVIFLPHPLGLAAAASFRDSPLHQLETVSGPYISGFSLAQWSPSQINQSWRHQQP